MRDEIVTTHLCAGSVEVKFTAEPEQILPLLDAVTVGAAHILISSIATLSRLLKYRIARNISSVFVSLTNCLLRKEE